MIYWRLTHWGIIISLRAAFLACPTFSLQSGKEGSCLRLMTISYSRSPELKLKLSYPPRFLDKYWLEKRSIAVLPLWRSYLTFLRQKALCLKEVLSMQNAISYDLPTYKPAPPIFPDTLVLLITDQVVPNNLPGQQNSRFSWAMAWLIVKS